MKNKDMVVGFLFDEKAEKVLLIEKQKPEWQKDWFNGIGGKIEWSEKPLSAIERETYEETGLQINDWQYFAVLHCPSFRIYYFRSFNDLIYEKKQTEKEKLWIFKLDMLPRKIILPSEWLLRMANDRFIDCMIIPINIRYNVDESR